MDDRQRQQMKLFVEDGSGMTGPFTIAVQSFRCAFDLFSSSFVFMRSVAIVEDKITVTLIISCPQYVAHTVCQG